MVDINSINLCPTFEPENSANPHRNPPGLIEERQMMTNLEIRFTLMPTLVIISRMGKLTGSDSPLKTNISILPDTLTMCLAALFGIRERS
jgi:hypothetical protein